MFEIDAALFDLDGTSVNSIKVIQSAYIYTINNNFGRELSVEVLGRHITNTPEGVFMGLMLDLELGDCSEELLVQLVRDLSGYQTRNIDQFVAFPGISQVLAELRDQKIKIAAVTSRGNAWAILEHTGLAPYYDDVVIPSDTNKVIKPHPAPVFKAMERLGVMNARRAIMIGDTDADVLAGKAAGTVTAGVTYGHDGPEIAKHKPDYLINHPVEIPSTVFNHTESQFATIS